MINKRVVFILGAGSSYGYGYPLGWELMSRLCSIDAEKMKLLEMQGFAEAQVHDFKDRMKHSGLSSVDAFIARNPSSARIAKIRIAQELAAYETGAEKSGPATRDQWREPEGWYKTLFGLMDSGNLEEFAANQCSFVSLNYDRSLTYELTKMLLNSYEGATQEKCVEIISKLNIAHVHGDLGPLPGYGLKAVEYGKIKTDTALLAAADRILTLGEKGSEKAYAKAAGWVDEAQTVICLGFGYHKEVIERLRLDDGSGARVWGSCQGLTQSRISVVIAPSFNKRAFNELERDRSIIEQLPRAPGPARDYIESNLNLILR